MDGFARRLLTVLASVFLLAYVGYQAFQMLYSPLETETVYSYSVYETVDTQGITIRNETTIPNNQSGYLFYLLKDGGKVSKGSDIASIYPTANDAWVQQQLDELDAEIATLKEIQSQGTANRLNLDLINKQIDRSLAELVSGVNSAEIKNIRTLRSDLLELLNKQQMTVGKVDNFSDQLKALTDKRNLLAGTYTKSTAAVKAPVAGYFVSIVDGLETALPYDKTSSLTVDQVSKALSATPAVKTDTYAGKVVGDYEWYFACVLDTASAARIRAGDEMEILFPFLSDEAVPVKVSAVNLESSGKAAVIFECSYMSENLADIRKETAQIRVVKHEGLRIPDDALVFNENKERGIYVRVGNTVAFRKVDILYSEPGYHICRDMEQMSQTEREESGINVKEYVRLYDDVVVKGKKGLYDGKIVR